MKPAYLKYGSDRYWPIFVKKSGKAVSIGIWELSAKSAIESAQQEIDRLKDAKLKKKAKKKHPPIFIDKNIVKNRYIVYVEVENVAYRPDSGGEWGVKFAECRNSLHFPTYQQAYQAGLDYLKSL